MAHSNSQGWNGTALGSISIHTAFSTLQSPYPGIPWVGWILWVFVFLSSKRLADYKALMPFTLAGFWVCLGLFWVCFSNIALIINSLVGLFLR